jgi:hypothetical protein
LGPKDLLKLSTGITKTVNDKHLIGLALMLVLAKVDKSIQLNDKKDDLAKKCQWKDIKKYLSEAREVHEQIQALKV